MELKLTTKVHYHKEKVRGRPTKEELYLLNGSPRRIEISPGYSVSPCDARAVNTVLTDWRFRETELPFNLLEEIIKDIEEFKRTDTIFDTGHDKNLIGRIDKSRAKIKTELKKRLGYL